MVPQAKVLGVGFTEVTSPVKEVSRCARIVTREAVDSVVGDVYQTCSVSLRQAQSTGPSLVYALSHVGYVRDEVTHGEIGVAIAQQRHVVMHTILIANFTCPDVSQLGVVKGPVVLTSEHAVVLDLGFKRIDEA